MEENKNIVWSHSRINTVMNNPAEYYLSYIQGIQPKIEKTALSIGSAIHHGLEIGSSDLTDYYNEKGNFNQFNNYTDEQLLAECIVEAYLKRKDDIYKDILEGEEILDEQHELKLTSHFNSKIFKDGHDFLGIIDLLLLTKKGFVLIDYKTSSRDVDWDSYKSQLYKYINLLNFNFPEAPVYKICIINLKKSGIRRKKNENDESYRNRIKEEYLHEESLINWHCYKEEEFDKQQLVNYENDLSRMIDAARMIVENKLFFVNYSNVTGMYGPSQYYDIFYKTKDSHFLYKIKDTIFDEEEGKIMEERDCSPIDMVVLENQNVLNKFDLFKSNVKSILSKGSVTKDKIFEELKKNYIVDDDLLNRYWNTLDKEEK